MEPCPVVKWAGGKARLLDRLLARLPEGKFTTYAEPFFGGGAMFFRLSSYKPRLFKRAILADKNAELVALYQAIKSEVEPLIARLGAYQEEHDRRDTEGRSALFYEVRERAPKTNVERGARLLFLNKTCFNGLWRVNSSGRFNVPFGRYAKPRILDPQVLLAAHRALAIAEISNVDFAEITKKLKKGDFAYFDPPYVPVSKTANFTAYSSPFGPEEQERLARELADLRKRGVRSMLSNAATEEMTALYKGHRFHVSEIDAARAINSDATKRGSVKELVVTTYGEHEQSTRAVPARPVRRRMTG
ncbi:MAG TPA: Dam family site-specific DNA-(adenine-N6)-methyltransferase [Labilithrix sp.]|nr:Dam family site-specific DNA-(adenine-N6)-methyltransferase [Labilithrix sp.]